MTRQIDVKAILKARACALAQPVAEAPSDAANLQLIEFNLAKESYAIEHHHVREVCPLKELTPLPCTPKFIAGLVNVRGQILPVIDIKKFFDLPEAGITDLHMVIIVQSRDVELGILADAIAGVRTVSRESVQRSLPTLTGIRSDYLKGVAEARIVILDIVRMLVDPRLTIDETVHA